MSPNCFPRGRRRLLPMLPTRSFGRSLLTKTPWPGSLRGGTTRPKKQTVPLVTAEPYDQEGIAGWLSMRIDKPSVMVVAVDTEHRIYGYTQQEIAENFPKLYVSVVFKPWKEGTEYKDGNWIFRNQFYVPPTYLDCYIAPSVQAEEGGETTEPSKLKAYAYAVDTTAWRIASYIDAAAGVITSKNDRRKPVPTPISLPRKRSRALTAWK